MQGKKAIVIGGTGLVGSELVRQLLSDERFGEIHVFGRRATGHAHAKLKEHVISFEDPRSWEQLVQGDVLFSALGTTLKQAGSKSAQFRIDHDYQLFFAKAAAANQVPCLVLISAAMASENSLVFYSKMKGKLETAVRSLGFRKLVIIRPGILEGKREQERAGEKSGIRVIRFLNRFGIFRSQKPVPAITVARAMINAAMDPADGIKTFSLLEVFALAGESG
jgi:uncharacterized protein YbjT (DUF2867 family)